MPRVREILKRVKRLELSTVMPVEGLIAGNYHSVFRGTGIEFSEVREYIPGDDVRSIDWNVTARMNHPYIKEYIEERNLSIYIAFDISRSNDFGFSQSKKEKGYEIAASIMLAALRNNDSVGLILYTGKVEKFIPDRIGRKHVLRLVREIVYPPESSGEGTDIGCALTYLSRVLKKKSIIFVISDFISKDYEKPLKHLKNRHDVILVNLGDVREGSIPDIGFALLEDEETGEQLLVDTSDPDFRAVYEEVANTNRAELTQKMRKIGTDMIHVETDQPFHVPLNKFLALRKKRARK